MKRQRRSRRPQVETLEDRCLLTASPALLSSVEGFSLTNDLFNTGLFESTPANPSGAAGPNHIVNVGNSTIQWFQKGATNPQMHTSLVNFFQPLGPLTHLMQPDARIAFDPKVLYDQYADRFVVMAMETFERDRVFASRVLLAVSDDSDPNGNWYYTSVNTLVNQRNPEDPVEILPYWGSTPGLAIDQEAIYVTANLISFDDEEPYGNRLWIVEKGEGEGGFYDNGRARTTKHDPATATGLDMFVNSMRMRSMQPAHVYGTAPEGVGTWLAMYDGRSDGMFEYVDVIRVDNPLNNPTFRLFSVNVGDLEEIRDPREFEPPPEAPQPFIGSLLDFGDRRTYDAVWRDGNLYVTTVIVPKEGPNLNQTSAHWFRFDTTNPNVLRLADQGSVRGDDIGFSVYTSFPSVAVDAEGNMALSFAASGPMVYPGAYYAMRAADDPPGELRRPQVLARGWDAYDLADFEGLNRWGRYSSVTIDPTDDVTFWTYNMYAVAEQGLGGRWGTRWGEFRMADVPPGPPPGPTTIRGLSWYDEDNDGFRDPNEPGLENRVIFVDLDGDGKLDLGEPTTRTNAAGEYSLTVDFDGPIIIREVLPAGWQHTFPDETAGVYEFNIPPGGGGQITGIDFGSSDAFGFDWGNAPAPYPTLKIDNGPSHPIDTNIRLGPTVLGTRDGEPNEEAAAPDNDGIRFLDPATGQELDALAPGTTFRLEVRAVGQAYLQGWIDYNRNGHWGDPGEQIVVNQALSTGTHLLPPPGQSPFEVPVTARPGTSYARFRYSPQRDLGPAGASNRPGEIEDYRIDIRRTEPIANNNAFTVEQNSSGNVFDVLANDVPGISGRASMRLEELRLDGTAGTAVIDRAGTPNIFTDDFIRYTPAPGAFAPDAFQYRLRDVGTGELSEWATVSVAIVPFAGEQPTAVDDTFFLPSGTTARNLDVLANDLRGPTGQISIPANGLDDTGTAGDIELVTVNGRQQVRYSPLGFAGSTQFRYTIVDADNVSSTATVTVHVAPHTQNDIVRFRLETTDLEGKQIETVASGNEFQVRAYVQDVRGMPNRPPLNNPDYPVQSPDQQGVFSAYMDLLYDSARVAYSGDAKFGFGDSFPSGQFIDSSVPGVLNEVGAFRAGGAPLGPGEFLLYVATFTATAPVEASSGVPVTFTADPADVLPLRETTVNFPEKAVDFDRIDFGQTTINIIQPETLVNIRLEATDLNGNPLPNNRLNAGDDFLVTAWVEDVRADVPNDLKGLFSAYLDVIYPPDLARPVASATSPFGYQISFGPLFTEVQKAEFLVGAGIVNEVGAVQSGNPQLFAGEEELFTARFTALTPPGGIGTLQFLADPADNLPVNEVTLIRAATGEVPDPGLSVPVNQIAYLPTDVLTIIAGSGEGEFTNPDNPLDVNNDGYVSPHDALILINFLNTHGAIDLRDVGGEGEAAFHRHYYDTNGDMIISPLDVMGVINYLNRSPEQGGEGEAAPQANATTVVDSRVDPWTAAQMIAAVPLPAATATDPSEAVDALLALTTESAESQDPVMAAELREDELPGRESLWEDDETLDALVEGWSDFEPLDAQLASLI